MILDYGYESFKSKTFLQVPLNLKDYTVDNAHVDMIRPHLVILYYVMDSDGDTIIYNSQWEKGETTKNSEETAKLLIKKKITPKTYIFYLFYTMQTL